MDLKEIIDIEHKRTAVPQMREMYFYKEGSFMRAYEYSAWLWCKYVREFKPTHRRAKSVDGAIIHIGCPVTSIANNLPDGATSVNCDDGSVVITLPDTMIPDTADLAAIAVEFDQWKQSFPITEPTKKKSDTEILENAFAVQPATMSGILQQILAFPIENKSMIECVTFLSELKVQLAKII